MPVNNALTPEGSNALGAAFGYYPQLKKYRQFNDPQASAEMPLQFMRGRLATTMGTPSDILNMFRSPNPMEVYGDVNYAPQQQVPYGSQELMQTLPLAPTSPAGQLAGNVGSVVPLSPAEILQAARVARQAALAGGATVKQAGKIAKEEINATLLGERPNTMLGAITPSPMYAVPPSGRSGFGAFDPRYDPRVLEQARMQALTRDIQVNPNAKSGPAVSLADFEGRPFITSMADRTAAGGKLLGVENVQFNRPVEFLGGQDFMFNNPGLVWSSGNAPAKALMKYADEVKSATGQNPIYLPYRMAPTGGDFAQFTGETMLAYADSAMGKTQKKQLDRSIKKFIPDWAGVSDPTSVAQFRDAPDAKRKAIKAMMDRDFRNEGGLNIGSARLAVSDPAQLAAQEGGVQNVGEIFAGNALQRSTHPAYPGGVPGQGIGTLAEDHNIFELLPDVVKARGIPDPKNPRPADLRAMQMHPYAGVISNALLKRLGY
jgi:hypothetical protein